MTAAMFIAECLKQEGVTKVFGQCGHTNYALIDACHRLGIEYVSFRHEQLAAHAADAYYRVSHKLAVVNVHLSPGLTNALTGVASAAADSTPMVVFAGNTPSYHHAREPHQGIRFHADASQGDIFRPICKRVWRVDDAKFLADVMPRALNLAQTGRPGPVLIDVPMDVFSQQIDVRRWTPSRGGPSTAASSRPTTASPTRRGCSPRAERPVIFAGNGVLLSEATDELRQLAELLDIPVATTLMGKGVFPERSPARARHDRHLGHGHRQRGARARPTSSSRSARRSARPTAAPGIRASRSRFPPSRLIQIDIEPQEIGKIYPVEVGLVGDAKATLRELIRHLRSAWTPFTAPRARRVTRSSPRSARRGKRS